MSASAKIKVFSAEHRAKTNRARLGKGKIYTWSHFEFGLITCTKPELSEKYGLAQGALSSVTTGKRPQHKGWSVL